MPKCRKGCNCGKHRGSGLRPMGGNGIPPALIAKIVAPALAAATGGLINKLVPQKQRGRGIRPRKQKGKGPIGNILGSLLPF